VDARLFQPDGHADAAETGPDDHNVVRRAHLLSRISF
jgi:hypothetical protein